MVQTDGIAIRKRSNRQPSLQSLHWSVHPRGSEHRRGRLEQRTDVALRAGARRSGRRSGEAKIITLIVEFMQGGVGQIGVGAVLSSLTQTLSPHVGMPASDSGSVLIFFI